MPLYITILSLSSIVTVVSTFPPRCSADRVSGCAELVSQLNWGLPAGNFEVNVSTGTIRFRNSIDFGHTSLDGQVITNMLESAHYIIDFYAGTIYDYLFKRP